MENCGSPNLYARLAQRPWWSSDEASLRNTVRELERRADGRGQRNSGATRQGTREPHFCARDALRNPPNAAGSVANRRPVFQAESELLGSDPEGSDPSLFLWSYGVVVVVGA